MKLYSSLQLFVRIIQTFVIFQLRYAGPASNAVKQSWGMGGWAAYLAGSLKIIVAEIDGRGTGNQGDQR